MTFTRCLDKCAPVVTREINRPLAPWFNDDLWDATRNKLKGDRHNMDLQHQYSEEKKIAKACLALVKKEYYKKKLSECKNDSSATWKIIKEIAPSPKSTSKTCEFVTQESSIEKAIEFNNFFANVGKKTFNTTQQTLIKSNIPPIDPLPSSYH